MCLGFNFSQKIGQALRIPKGGDPIISSLGFKKLWINGFRRRNFGFRG